MTTEAHFEPSTLENIDQAFLSFVQDLKVNTYSNKGWKQAPVVWTGAERSFQVKSNNKTRDSKGVLILPQISVRRLSTGKSRDFQGKYFAAVPENSDEKGGSSVVWTKRINGQKTSEFERARSIRKESKLNFKATAPLKENEAIVYEHIMLPNVVYLTLNYTIVLRSEYQEQMNQLITPFLVNAGNHKAFIIENGDWKYECFYEDDYGQSDNVDNFDEAERIFKSEIKVKVLGYIMGSGPNAEKPTKVIRENAVKLILEEKVLSAAEYAELYGDD